MSDRKSFEEVLREHGFLIYSNVGVSMKPLIREGRDLMLIESVETRRPKLYDAVLFRRPSVKGRGEYVLHRILKINADGSYWIVGDNCIGGETVKPENVLGVLTAVKRNAHQGRPSELKIDDRAYKLYLNCWCKPYALRFAAKRGYSLARRAGSRLKRLIIKRK